MKRTKLLLISFAYTQAKWQVLLISFYLNGNFTINWSRPIFWMY